MNDKPWENEPDRKEFFYKGFKCLILRMVREPSKTGHLNGYVLMPKNKLLEKASYDDIGIQVHGGLTYYGNLKGSEGEDKMWLGFDCAHSGDYNPGYEAYNFKKLEYETYKDMGYVENELKSMVDQMIQGIELTIKTEKKIKISITPGDEEAQP